MTTPSRWQSIPRRSAVIFLIAVFFIFASFGFTNDVIDMGLQPPLRFAVGVLLSGSFAVAYAAAGMILRGRFWKAFVPLFLLQFACMTFLGYLLPEAARPAQINAFELGRLQTRLVFDGLAIIVSVCLGYAGFVHVSISESRRHIRAEAEKASLEGEMSAAREVQRVMVPEDLPRIPGYAVESVYRPAAEVGGDFFQVIPLKSGRSLAVIGDVSGKGLRAAMVVSMIVGTLGTVSGYTEEPAEILDELNRRLCGHMQEGFATCQIVRLEEQGSLTIANAGHLPPYMNGAEITFPGSLPLGLTETATYEQTSLQMTVGDAIVLLTDGIAEAHNDQRVLLGFTRIESMLTAGATARNIAEAAQQHGQNDDITALRVARVA
jgi:Stage II sporulation protein E (SpoIIE)